MKATLKKLSICPCGFPAMNESIPLGTEYEINPQDKDSFTFTCGGCGKVQHITAVWADHRDGSGGGYLPEKVFEEPTEKTVTE